MNGSYTPELVALSIIVAIIASYTALELAGRVSQRQGKGFWIWLIGGAVSMGTGIWSMHFIGMLAFSLPIHMAYDVATTMLSMLIAVGVSGLALFVVRSPILTGRNITTGATLMGIGISAMHYTGMQAMQMSPPIEYDPLLFIVSVIIAIVASFAALWIAFQLRHKHFSVAILAKLGSAVIMGFAITGMHYTGMAAAQFSPASFSLAADSTGAMHHAGLAFSIGIVTISILILTLGISALDAYLAVQTEKWAASLQSANQQLRDLAFYDNLTGLPNRILLNDRMEQAAARAARTGKSFALLFVDLDRFKPVNDSYGHVAGDELLKEVAYRLTACIRKSDTVARTGGDEFVIVLSEIEGPDNAAIVCTKVLAELSQPFLVQRHELEITSSIGISIYPDDGTDLLMLKANADKAMYQAKHSGRNKYQFFTPGMDSEMITL